MSSATVIWTKIDEAPALATYSLLPIVRAFVKGTGVEFEPRDISLSGRILAAFPDRLREEQRVPDELTALGELAKTPAANIVKLPNISASIPQLRAAIAELQTHGYEVPDYPEEPESDAEHDIQMRYARVLGSAVNPVLREGNSDRRAAASVKRFAQQHPHRMMKAWPVSGSKTRVAHMEQDDFFGSERSTTVQQAGDARIEFVASDGATTVLKERVPLQADEVVDAAVMRVASLRAFFGRTIEEASTEGALLSLHLKATMMKVSDPIMFGHCVSVFYESALQKHADVLRRVGANVNNGLAGVLEKLDDLPDDQKTAIKDDIAAVYATRPSLAMVDSRKGITNLHVPNNVIIDASMPNVVRDGGRMWNREDELQDTVAMVPDRSYATMYQAIIEDCQKYGQFDPATMGSVSNVGLMARKAEEYGSHDKTFVGPGSGTIRVVDARG
ncbi:MAG: NADP-dependent isocitrate dehydrogenase, partial [Acidobacteriota bacterium]|nr:NADP-dependent isocitrate dehydrogenase [Acidobacteriota bacterium]